MEGEELEVPNSANVKGSKALKGGSVSSASTSSASPPASPSKRSTGSPTHKGKSNSFYPHGTEVNGDGNDYLERTEPVSPTNKSSPLSGLAAHKISNIKIKKQYSKIYRIKTKILQNLGKADKTTDEIFDDYEANFNKQQLNANRLHKEISNYLRCARALHGASKALYETLSEVYEPEWVGHDLIYAQAQNSDMLWTDFCHKMQDQTLVPLTAYTQEFPEIRKKIDKRGRKLVDYDSQRHQLENLQRSARRDEYKIARVQDQLENARSTYESLNKELYEELPSIFDQRIPNTANSLQTFFAAEQTFMQESSKISKELELIAEKLGKECYKGTYNTKRGFPPKAPRPITVSGGSPQSPRTANSPTVRPTISGPISPGREETGRPYEEIEFEDKKVNGTAPKVNGEVIGTSIPPGDVSSEPPQPRATTEGLPPGVLYRVKATYKYVREDVDELGFEVGELINVVEYDDPEEQEEGWLCGVKESTQEKGLFPANFTRPL